MELPNNSMDTVYLIIALLAYAGILAFSIRKGVPTTYTLVEYQRAVLYRRGLPVKEVGPGRYWVWTKYEKFFTVDTRPIQVAFENQGAVLRTGLTPSFGVLGSARVTSARKAIYSARNYNQMPAFILLGCTRSVINGLTVQQLEEGKEKIAAEVISRATPRLQAAGFELISFRLTQLTIPTPQPQSAN